PGRHGKAQWFIVFINLQSFAVQFQIVVVAIFRAGRDFEVLKVRVVVAGRLQSEQAKLTGDVLGRRLQFGGTVSTSFQGIVCQVVNMPEVALDRQGIGPVGRQLFESDGTGKGIQKEDGSGANRRDDDAGCVA